MARFWQIPTARTPIEVLVGPFQEFAERSASGGVVLLACAAVALTWANSPWRAAYAALWHTPFVVSVGTLSLSRDLHFLVNDGLMAVFFFVVGLEIKRQLLAGELASPRQAALPIAAALGGVAVPAFLYLLFNFSGAGARGWSVPIATDIAFAIGILALAGERAPAGLKVFLAALAIVDDLIAVFVIALFHTADIDWPTLGAANALVLMAVAANRLGVRRPLPYALLGVVLWLLLLQAGIHATIGGVLLAFAIPVRTYVQPRAFLRHGRAILDHFDKAASQEPFEILKDAEQQAAIEALEDACQKMQPPLRRLEHALHPWVTFGVLPLFALANAGVAVPAAPLEALSNPVTAGTFFGLFLGKPAGILLAAWLAVRSGLCQLPENVSWRHVQGASWLAGIGFTMSLFMAALSFRDEELVIAAKVGILSASFCAGLIGFWCLRRCAIPPASAGRPGGA